MQFWRKVSMLFVYQKIIGDKLHEANFKPYFGVSMYIKFSWKLLPSSTGYVPQLGLVFRTGDPLLASWIYYVPSFTLNHIVDSRTSSHSGKRFSPTDTIPFAAGGILNPYFVTIHQVPKKIEPLFYYFRG